MLQDLRYSMRRLVQGRAWAAVVVLSCALGIGANTALFSLIDAVLLRALPVDRADQLVYLNWRSGPNALYRHLSGNSDRDEATGLQQSTSFSTQTFAQIRRQSRTLSEVFAFAPLREANVRTEESAEIVNGQFVSGNYFAALGLRMARGRSIVDQDDHPGAPPVVVISDRLWQRRFDRDPDAIGKTMAVNGLAFTVIGVVPPDFAGTLGFSFAADFSIPLAFESTLFPEDEHAQPWSWWLRIMGRMAPGARRAQVRAELEPVVRSAAWEGWTAVPASTTGTAEPRDPPQLQILDGSRGLADQVRDIAQLLASFAAVAGIMLLIVVVNVANLGLARAIARRREIGVRLAIGASRARLVRLLLTENLVLCMVAGALGVLFSAWSIDLLAFFISATHDMALDLRLDLRVLGFALLVSLLTGVGFGLAPALRATRVDLFSQMKEGGLNLMGTSSRVTRILVTAQLALSLVLLVGAGLLARSTWRLQGVEVGFNSESLLLFEVMPEAAGYNDARTVALYEEVIRRLQALPGVRAATISDYPLVSGSGSGNSIYVQGIERLPNYGAVRRLKIRSNFVRAMELTILQGRDLSARDGRGAPRVALVNQTLAERFFPNERAVGRRFGFSAERSGDIEIVGVVKDASIDEVRSPIPPTIYLSYPQQSLGAATFEVRTAASPMRLVPAIAEAMRQAASDVPAIRFRTQRQQIEIGYAEEQVLARTAVFFSAIALLLACIGLYGMVSHTVARRTSEIALRVALGARRDVVIWMVLREVALLLVAGLAIGLVAAFSLAHTLAGLLYELAPTDPLTIALAVSTLIAVGALAAYFPAQRAARTNPLVALKWE